MVVLVILVSFLFCVAVVMCYVLGCVWCGWVVFVCGWGLGVVSIDLDELID